MSTLMGMDLVGRPIYIAKEEGSYRVCRRKDLYFLFGMTDPFEVYRPDRWYQRHADCYIPYIE